MRFYSLITSSLLVVSQSVAQTVVPFSLDGGLEDVVATNLSQFNTGGSIKIYGNSITVPENLMVQFPAAWIPFQAFAQSYSQNPAQFQGFEMTVDGNKVDNVPRAGRIAISQFNTAAGSGFIGTVNFDGTMQILGGPLLRVNTPNGVFAAPCLSNVFFTSDEQNPSITSFSGYPMCVPRSATDLDCPATNRPAGTARVYTPTNTSAMVPFLAGDFLTWSGVKNGANEVLAYTIVAEDLQPLTKGDSGDPVYIRVEDIVIGLNDGTTNTEVATTKFVGYVSDSTASVTVYRIEIDPCTGAEVEVQVAAGTVKAGDVRNKFDIRITDAAVSKSSREYRVKSNKGQKIVAKGLQAGQYVSPISDLIWPEVNVPGTVWPPNAFQIFGQLKDGFVMDNKQYGQLKPWPGASAPAPVKVCTGTELSITTPAAPPDGQAPIANAGLALKAQLAGSLITITGNNTNAALTNAQLTFQWSGPADVTLTNADKPVMSFVNPWQDPVAMPTSNRTFTLKICLASNTTVCSASSVSVITDKFVDKVTITSYQFASKQGGTLTVSATSNNVLTGTNGANLQLQLSGTGAWQALTQDTSNPGLYTFSARSVGKQPTILAVKSSHNTTATTTTALI